MKRYIRAAEDEDIFMLNPPASLIKDIAEELNVDMDTAAAITKIYANPYFTKFDKDRIMSYIKEALDLGLDIRWFTKSNFDDSRQIWQIFKGLKSGVDVSLYANPEFLWQKMEYIREALENGYNAKLLANPEFNAMETYLIYTGLKLGLDVSWYADPKFDEYQMQYILQGLKAGVDVSQYADPKYDYTEMKNILKTLEHKYIFNPKSKVIVRRIGEGLNVDTSAAKFLANMYADSLDDEDCNTEEECINFIIENARDDIKETISLEGIDGLIEYNGIDWTMEFLNAAKALGIDVDEY